MHVVGVQGLYGSDDARSDSEFAKNCKQEGSVERRKGSLEVEQNCCGSALRVGGSNKSSIVDLCNIGKQVTALHEPPLAGQRPLRNGSPKNTGKRGSEKLRVSVRPTERTSVCRHTWIAWVGASGIFWNEPKETVTELLRQSATCGPLEVARVQGSSDWFARYLPNAVRDTVRARSAVRRTVNKCIKVDSFHHPARDKLTETRANMPEKRLHRRVVRFAVRENWAPVV